MLWARPGALDVAARASLLVLDIDGVLLDPRPSFYEAARQASSWAASRILGSVQIAPVTNEEIGAFKSVGGWNDDFDLACACTWALVAREVGPGHPPISATAEAVAGGLESLRLFAEQHVPGSHRAHGELVCPTPVIRSRAAATYAGADRAALLYGIDPAEHEGLRPEGLWPLEVPLINPALLRGAPIALGLFTGRSRAETNLALERLDFSVPEELRAVDDGVTPRKPAPDGLYRLWSSSRRREPMLFAGDSIDDQRAAAAFKGIEQGNTDLTFVRVAGPDASDSAISRMKQQGADIIVSCVDELLTEIWKEARR